MQRGKICVQFAFCATLTSPWLHKNMKKSSGNTLETNSTDKWAWMTNTCDKDKLCHIPILLPEETKPAWDALKARARSPAPRDDDKVTLCNGAISWYWDSKSRIFSADITNQTSKQIGYVLQGMVIQKHKRIPWWFTTNHRSRQPPSLSVTGTRIGALMMFQLLKGIWKIENLSERTRRMQHRGMIQTNQHCSLMSWWITRSPAPHLKASWHNQSHSLVLKRKPKSTTGGWNKINSD